MTGETKDFLNVKELNVGSQDGTGSSATNPSIKFGDGDTGFYESSDDVIEVTINGAKTFSWIGNNFESDTAAGAAMINESATSANPTLVPNQADSDTGIGWNATDELSLIAGGTEAIRFFESGNAIRIRHQVTIGITANTGSSQGDGILASAHNVISISGSAGDAVTLPATFPIGEIITIKNDAAANAIDIFPASGDDLGAGTNTALSLAAGRAAIFLATSVNSTWTNILEGI